MSRTHTILAALVAAASAAACASDSGQSMVIQRNVVPGEGCVGTTDSSADVAAGRVRADSPVGYYFSPIVQSLVEERDGAARTIQLRGADVVVRDADDAELGEFGVAFTGNLEPGGTFAVAFEAVPPEVLAGVGDGLIFADVQVYGTLAGDDIRSDHFVLPITVCTDCITINLGACSSLGTDFEPGETGNACNPFQDGTVECCSIGEELVCPAVGTAAEPPV